ncbi:MAG: YheU family protein [Gammaproteobacteria bacterium]|nr:YheU family protein [Gammaproteobacteria bacterium]
MIVPWQEIEGETLNNLIKEYVISKLEDYQMDNSQMEDWITEVKRKLERGEALVEWSEANETVTIVDAKKYSY